LNAGACNVDNTEVGPDAIVADPICGVLDHVNVAITVSPRPPIGKKSKNMAITQQAASENKRRYSCNLTLLISRFLTIFVLSVWHQLPKPRTKLITSKGTDT
jgi:hypothetical protein